MIPASLPVRVHPRHESCCPFLCWQIYSECFMLHYTAGRSWGSGHLNYEMKLDLQRVEPIGLCNLNPPASPRCSAVVSLCLAALFVQEGWASAQQTIHFLVVAGLMTWNCSQMQELWHGTLSNLLILSVDVPLVEYVEKGRWLIKEVAFCQNL